MHQEVFEREESVVRYYCRKIPNLLSSARGALVHDAEGGTFIDFMSACGALNYGHNHPALKSAAMDYLARDGILAGLDFHTAAKLEFIEHFRSGILEPRGLNYKLQFPGPTGANCVEAAIKLARKSTGRFNIAAFTNAFHGMTAGALSVTGSSLARRSSGPSLNGVVRIPFEGYHGASIADPERFAAMAGDPSGGLDPVAAIIVETVQGEGGLNVASVEWLRALSEIAKKIGALLIVDDIQAGCGRTGTFFSFERAGIQPDIVCLAKSISGLGLPMSLLLLNPAHDLWSPGEHNGTFRGNALAFVSATAAVRLWTDGTMAVLPSNCGTLSGWSNDMSAEFATVLRSKGIGMMQGLEFSDPQVAEAAAGGARRRGVMIECCGPHDEVLKVMAPLNIEPELFREGLARVSEAIREALVANRHGSAGACRVERDPVPSERDEAPLDPYDDGGDAISGSELPHPVA
ncbi:diaminobutyrate--2-oxoglutarate transaminase [Bradyrhizobium manausense]|uniref:diaminobutyrate--2-oxoglutarate transaminase n=1 Tax=Bradyrhizobium manausense TaxID=989370 RepID=UPI002011BEBC|nr:diaminobutyrate--2-oxoglutarate transaminase [Bradyrhizobium manausense]